MTLQEAIARQEGFYVAGSLSSLNHNPGNIIIGNFAIAHGAVGSARGYAIFPDDASGWKALTDLLSGPAYKGKSVEVAINRYCPPPNGDDLTINNDPDAYVRNICVWCQCTPDTIIDGLLG